MLNTKAFTFVEIIVSAVILAIVISGMFAVYKSGERYSSEDKHKLQALSMNRQVLEYLEEISARDFDNSELLNGTHDASDLVVDDPLSEYKVSFQYTVVYVDKDGDISTVEYKKIGVTYRWEYWEKEGAAVKQVSLSTILVNPSVSPPEGVTYPIP